MKNNLSSPTSAKREWTEAQRLGIVTVDRSLLVSAAAGSGKTTVLAERCVHLICDGSSRCSVDELLVATFTDAAAAEMKARIHGALSRRYAQEPLPHIARQLAIIDSAQVGTLHAFCARLVRQYFHLLGIDPNFVIMDSDEAKLLKSEIARELLSDRFDQDDAADFRQFVDDYGDGDDQNILDHILHTHGLLCSVVDPVGWMDQSIGRLEEAIDQPLEKSELGKAMLAHIRRSLDSLLESCRQAGEALKHGNQFPMYVAYLREIYSIIHHLRKVLGSHGLDALIEETQTLQLPTLPRVPSSVPGKEVAKGRVDAIREEINDGVWRRALLFTPAEWKQGLQQIVPHARVLFSLVQEFAERYTQAKTEQISLDFSDLERLALRALRDGEPGLHPSPVARSMQRQFKHVLVDEYQDINEVQNAILTLISRESAPRRGGAAPNLFCVGDVKQSIYRFRLAEPALFLQRRDEYSKPNSHGSLIDLQQNFRSRPPLLNAINGVFERLMTLEAADLSYDKSQRLEPGLTYPDQPAGNCFTGAPIELHLLTAESPGASAESGEDLDRTGREAALVARRIRQMLGLTGDAPMHVVENAADPNSCRPLRFGDIVILLRSLQFKADLFADALRAAGVPVHSESTTGYFEATEINDMLALLQILDNAQQDIPLAAVLRSPLAALPRPDDSLARIRLAYPELPFHQAVTQYSTEQTDDLAKVLRGFQNDLSRWRLLSRHRPLAELIWTVYDQTGYLAFCSGLPNGRQRQANLIELYDRAQQFGTFRRQGLGRFLEFLEKLKSESDLGQAAIASEADNVVRIMSIHRAKGLEFPVVIVGDLGKAINMQDAHGPVLLDRKAGLGLQVVDPDRRVRYPSLAWTLVQQRIRQQTIAEELRVLYVAMTRAKEHLILVGTCSAKSPDLWAGQWTGHQGPLPAEMVLGARCMLDWLGPTAVAGPADGIRMYRPTLEEIARLAAEQNHTPPPSPVAAALATLKPLDPAPPVSPQAKSVIDRLSQKYRFSQAARSAAAVSVTAHSKQASISIAPATALVAAEVDRLVPKPSFLSETILTAADRGTATHAVLEHLNFSDAASRAAIDKQIQKMVVSHRLAPPAAACVDIDAIQWLLNEKPGHLLVQKADTLLREVPVYFPVPLDGRPVTDPLDQIMVRGRLDVLVPVGDKFVIVDYKTDRVEGAALDERVDFYRPQLALYRAAIEQITGKTVAESILVFLHPRECRTV